MTKIECSIVEVCVTSKIKGKNKFLLMRRSKNVKLYPGIWQIVTGHSLKKEKLQNTALRELYEETNFTPTKFWVLPQTNTFINPKSNSVNITAIFAAEVKENSKPKLSNEHDKFIWANFTQSKKLLVWPGQITALEIFKNYILSNKKTEKLSRIIL